MKRKTGLDRHFTRRENRINALTRAVEHLLNRAKQWRIVSDTAADELTYAVIKVEQALGRLE